MRLCFLALVILISNSSLANVCKVNPNEANLLDLKEIGVAATSEDANKVVVSHQIIKGETLKVGQVIETKDGESKTITFTHPVEVQFSLEENTKIEIFQMPTDYCGPKLKQLQGSLISDGIHSETENCEYEVETPNFYLNPVGTKYSSSVDLSEALAELNGENTENFSVEKGSLEVKLVKVSSKSKIKKISYSKTTKSKTVTKSEKSSKKSQTVAVSQVKSKKLKLKAGAKAIAKVKKSKDKKEKIADLEVVEPWEN